MYFLLQLLSKTKLNYKNKENFHLFTLLRCPNCSNPVAAISVAFRHSLRRILTPSSMTMAVESSSSCQVAFFLSLSNLQFQFQPHLQLFLSTFRIYFTTFKSQPNRNLNLFIVFFPLFLLTTCVVTLSDEIDVYAQCRERKQKQLEKNLNESHVCGSETETDTTRFSFYLFTVRNSS